MNTKHETYLLDEIKKQNGQLRQFDREARAREWYLNCQIRELRRELNELKINQSDQ